jgi:tetratricopeptide (TPR) repeat protein
LGSSRRESYPERLGRIDEAIKHLSEALRIRPDYAEARNNLKKALAAQKEIQRLKEGSARD